MAFLPTIEFKPSLLRVAGSATIAVSLLMPLAVTVWRAYNPSEDAVIPQLRPEMVVLPAGRFEMGSPDSEANRDSDETLHEVELTRPFLISRTEVTQQQYQAVTGQIPTANCSSKSGIEDAGQGDNLPVVCISWLDAVHYANALSELEGLDSAYQLEGDNVTWAEPETDGYRLPTEAEWEYAARAGTNTVYVGTDIEEKVCDYANVAGQTLNTVHKGVDVFSCDDKHLYLSPVENRLENPWKLFGFGGNATEWVWDQFGEYEVKSYANPKGPESGGGRVVRGGSFGYSPRFARVAGRIGSQPSERLGNLGFRLSRSCPSSLLHSGTLPAADCFPSEQ